MPYHALHATPCLLQHGLPHAISNLLAALHQTQHTSHASHPPQLCHTTLHIPIPHDPMATIRHSVLPYPACPTVPCRSSHTVLLVPPQQLSLIRSGVSLSGCALRDLPSPCCPQTRSGGRTPEHACHTQVYTGPSMWEAHVGQHGSCTACSAEQHAGMNRGQGCRAK